MLETIRRIAEQVRNELTSKYGKGVELAGKCIESSERIQELLKQEGIVSKTVEGWCVYDYFENCTNQPYDAHTWLEVGDIYVDVSADQFEYQFSFKIPEVIVGERPYYMQYNEPDEDQLDEMGW